MAYSLGGNNTISTYVGSYSYLGPIKLEVVQITNVAAIDCA